MSRDPIWERGGENVFALHGNNSLSFVDALGLEERDVNQVLRGLIDYTGDWRKEGCACYAEDLADTIRNDSVLANAIIRIAGQTHSSGRRCLKRIRCLESCPHAHCNQCAQGMSGEYWLPLEQPIRNVQNPPGGEITICSSTRVGEEGTVIGAATLRRVIAHELQHASDCGRFSDSCNTQEGCVREFTSELRAHIAGDTSSGSGSCQMSAVVQGDVQYSYCVEKVLGIFVAGAPSSIHNPCARCRANFGVPDNGDLGSLALILIQRGIVPGRGEISRGVILPSE